MQRLLENNRHGQIVLTHRCPMVFQNQRHGKTGAQNIRIKVLRGKSRNAFGKAGYRFIAIPLRNLMPSGNLKSQITGKARSQEVALIRILRRCKTKQLDMPRGQLLPQQDVMRLSQLRQNMTEQIKGNVFRITDMSSIDKTAARFIYNSILLTA